MRDACFKTSGVAYPGFLFGLDLTPKIYGIEFLYAGPLFIHQLSHVWVDFRAIRDEFMRQQGLDYFENSRRATFVQQQYAIRNPREFAHYDEFCWGITSSDGLGPATIIRGR